MQRQNVGEIAVDLSMGRTSDADTLASLRCAAASPVGAVAAPHANVLRAG